MHRPLRLEALNTINTVRIELGVTRPQMLALLGAKAGRRRNLLHADDANVDPVFLAKARSLRGLYREWKAGVMQSLVKHEAGSKTFLTNLELQALTGIRETTITTLRHRGVVRGIKDSAEYVYGLPEIRRLINLNSTILADVPRKTRGPLANSFLRWLRSLEMRSVQPKPKQAVVV